MKIWHKFLAFAMSGAAALLWTACSSEQTVSEFTEPTEYVDPFTDDENDFGSEYETIVPVESDAPAQPPEPAAETPVQDVPEADVPTQAAGYSFRSAVWLAKDFQADTEQFYCFYDDAGGKTIAQENGLGVGFTCELAPETAVFHFGSPEDAIRAELLWTDADHVTLLWENGKAESLTFLRENGAEDPVFFTNEQLCTMALDDYQRKTGYRPSMAAAVINLDESISIQMYDLVGDHISTSDWYTVDRYTGTGYNVTEEPITLAVQPETQPGETLPPAETQPGETLPAEGVQPVPAA